MSESWRASCARRSLSSVTAASARAVWPLSSALPACTPTVSSRRRSRRLNDSPRSTASMPTTRFSPRSATTIAAGRPRPVSPMRRSGRVFERSITETSAELLEQRALGQRGLARERAARALAPVHLRAQDAPVGGVQHERRAVGADERARVLEQHAGRRLGAGGRVHVAHDRQQRLDLRALATRAGVRAPGERERGRRHGQQASIPKSTRAGRSSAPQRPRLGSEQPHAERDRHEGDAAPPQARGRGRGDRPPPAPSPTAPADSGVGSDGIQHESDS